MSSGIPNSVQQVASDLHHIASTMEEVKKFVQSVYTDNSTHLRQLILIRTELGPYSREIEVVTLSDGSYILRCRRGIMHPLQDLGIFPLEKVRISGLLRLFLM